MVARRAHKPEGHRFNPVPANNRILSTFMIKAISAFFFVRYTLPNS